MNRDRVAVQGDRTMKAATSFRYPPDSFSKRSHKAGCDGDLIRRAEVVLIDRSGRVGNGGWVAHDYRCNMSWNGCEARVLITEHAIRQLAVAVERRRP